MKRIALALISVAAVALAGCDGTSDELTGNGAPGSNDPNATAGNEETTYDHSNDPGAAAPGAENAPPADPGQVRLVGAPEVQSRLHSCGKLTYDSLGTILASRGLTGQGQRPANTQSGQQIYAAGPTRAAFGGANYNGRVPEAPFASTSALSKMFDIFAMASYDAVAANYAAPACGTTKVLGADGKFTKDGLSCLMGKPARDEHVAIANDAIAKNATDGAKIAIAALLASAHSCQ
ncbi:MAG: hypothetical protein JST00_17345 [Deltaproteobacteria bacterium]|nr:hypothetical protein [Deltaproteobacteria bacterium]